MLWRLEFVVDSDAESMGGVVIDISEVLSGDGLVVMQALCEAIGEPKEEAA